MLDCKCFCDLCVTRMVRFWLKDILVCKNSSIIFNWMNFTRTTEQCSSAQYFELCPADTMDSIQMDTFWFFPTPAQTKSHICWHSLILKLQCPLVGDGGGGEPWCNNFHFSSHTDFLCHCCRKIKQSIPTFKLFLNKIIIIVQNNYS